MVDIFERPKFIPALLVYPHVALTVIGDVLGDRKFGMICQVVDWSAADVRLLMLNGDYLFSVNRSGICWKSEYARLVGRGFVLNWQGKCPGFSPTHEDISDFAEREIAVGSLGPMSAEELLKDPEFGTLPLRSAAARLAALGDPRFQELLQGA